MRALLIEDDASTAQSIELMLKSENCNVYTTDLGEEGVDLGKLYARHVWVRGAALLARFQGEDANPDPVRPSQHGGQAGLVPMIT
jgi:DNA-binding response OmpR family regulator